MSERVLSSHPPCPSHAASAPERASPTRSGTLRWGDFAQAFAQAPPSSSPVRGGTLKWGELMAQLPPVLAPPLPPLFVAAPAARAEVAPPRDSFESLNLYEALAPLLCAGLVRRSGRDVARRRGLDNRRDPSDAPPTSEAAAPPRDLASAIQEALEDDEG